MLNTIPTKRVAARSAPRWAAMLLLVVLSGCVARAAPLAPQNRATPETHWAKEYAENLAEMGVLGEIPIDLDQPAPRGLVVAMTVRVLGLPLGAIAQKVFSDVDKAYSYAGEIAAAKQVGLVKGEPDGSFSPSRPLSRAELAAILRRGFEPFIVPPAGDLTPFLDLRSHWALADVMWCARGGLITGFPDYTYGPEQPCTVGQVSKVLRLAMRQSLNPATLPSDELLIATVVEHNLRFGRAFDSTPWDFGPLLQTVTGYAHRNLSANTAWLLRQQQSGRSFRYEAMSTEGRVMDKTAFEATVLTSESMKEFVEGFPHDVSQTDVYFLRKTSAGWMIFR